MVSLLSRAKWISLLETSWMFLIRVNWEVIGMKRATVEEEEGVNMLLKYVCCACYMANSHKNTHTSIKTPTLPNKTKRRTMIMMPITTVTKLHFASPC